MAMSTAAADAARTAGRRFVITGASSGLGLATARELARNGARVVLAVRDVAAGERIAADLGGSTEVRPLDLADLGSVRRFAESWDGDLDVLINNAGVGNLPERRATADGFELQIGTNHLGHFALTNLLLPRITDRVVTVASSAHRFGRLDLTDLNWESRPYRLFASYGQSKLANLLFTLELQRRLVASGSPVRALAAHPGVAASNLGRHLGPVLGVVTKAVGTLVQQSAEAGAAPTLFAATRDLPGASYVGPDGFGEVRGRPTLVGRTTQAADPDLARRLWTLSEELTGVTFPLRASA
jgi:NAD(P)-dependent dehydrogenase (short-subunit alcohol dehydrogenase family)